MLNIITSCSEQLQQTFFQEHMEDMALLGERASAVGASDLLDALTAMQDALTSSA